MEDADLFNLSVDPNDASVQEKARAMAAALRQRRAALEDQQAVGQLGQWTGNKQLAAFGGGLAEGAQAGLQGVQQEDNQLAQVGERRLQRKTEGDRNAALAQYHMDTLEQRRLEEARKAAEPKNTVVKNEDGVVQVVNLKDPTQAPVDVHTSTKKLSRPGGTGAGGAGDGLKPNQREKLWSDFAHAVSTYQGRGNINAKSQESLQRAEALEALLQVPDLNAITPQQMREASTALAGLISRGGSQAVSQIEHLTPESYAGKFADIKQKLLNEPQGADAKAFLQNMMETAAREKHLIAQQIHKGQIQAVPNFAHLAKSDAKRYRSVLQGANINPDELDENGLPVQAAPVPAAPSGTGGSAAPAVDPAMQARAAARVKELVASGVKDKAAIRAQLEKEGIKL